MSDRRTDVETLASSGPTLNVTRLPVPSRLTHRLFHSRKCSDRFNIHRPFPRGAVELLGKSAYESGSLSALPVARFIPGDNAGG